MNISRRLFFSYLPGLGGLLSSQAPLEIDDSASTRFQELLQEYLEKTPPERQSLEHIEFLKSTIKSWQDVELARAKAIRARRRAGG